MYSNYKKHYELDAQFIVPPRELPPSQRASEERRLQSIVRLLEPDERPRVLDVGCGSGWLARNVAVHGMYTVASDLSLSGVRKARAYSHPLLPASSSDAPLPLVFLVADIYDLPFPSRSFDIVLLSEVCEHLEDIDAALEQVRYVLRDQGKLILTVPYREKIKWHLCIHCNRPTPANAHLHSFDGPDVRHCLERHGLRVIETLTLSNKFLEALRFPRWTMWMPYILWRTVDRLFNAISGRSAFLCILAEGMEHSA